MSGLSITLSLLHSYPKARLKWFFLDFPFPSVTFKFPPYQFPFPHMWCAGCFSSSSALKKISNNTERCLKQRNGRGKIKRKEKTYYVTLVIYCHNFWLKKVGLFFLYLQYILVYGSCVCVFVFSLSLFPHY